MVVSQLEQLQGKMDRLEHECRSMRDKLEEEELNAQKVCTKGKGTTKAFLLHAPDSTFFFSFT